MSSTSLRGGVKQYFKEQHALRMETTINNPTSKPSVRLRICRAAFFYAKLHLRIFRPNWAALLPDPDGLPRSLCAVLDQLDVEIQKLHEEAAIAA
jgi:hypothetical protein